MLNVWRVATPVRAATVAAALLASAVPSVARAADSDPPPPPSFYDYAIERARGLGEPANLLVLAAAGLLASAAAETEDAAATARFLDRYEPGPAFHMATAWAGPYGMAAATGGLWLAGRLSGDGTVRRATRDLAASFLVSVGAVGAIKVSVDRERPNGDRYSFPSGHTASAFASATVFQRHFGWKAGTPAFTMAALTACARVEDEKHYLSDVLFGAGIGLAAAGAFGNAHHAGDWSLAVTDGGIGIRRAF